MQTRSEPHIHAIIQPYGRILSFILTGLLLTFLIWSPARLLTVECRL